MNGVNDHCITTSERSHVHCDAASSGGCVQVRFFGPRECTGVGMLYLVLRGYPSQRQGAHKI